MLGVQSTINHPSWALDTSGNKMYLFYLGFLLLILAEITLYQMPWIVDILFENISIIQTSKFIFIIFTR